MFTLKTDELGWYLGTMFVIPSYRINLSAGLYSPYGFNASSGFGKELKQYLVNENYCIIQISIFEH